MWKNSKPSKSALQDYCQPRKLIVQYEFTTNISQEFISTVSIIDNNDHSVLQTRKFTSKIPHSTKKKSEADAALVALENLVGSEIDSPDEGVLDKVLLAAAYSVKDPCRTENSYVVHLLNDANIKNDGWLCAETFLIFAGVQAAINRVDDNFRRDCISSAKCIRDAFSLLLIDNDNSSSISNNNANINDTYKSVLLSNKVNESSQVLHVKKIDNEIWVKRKKSLTEAELALIESEPNSQTIDNRKLSISIIFIPASKDKDIQEMNIPIFRDSSIYSILASISNVLNTSCVTVSHSLYTRRDLSSCMNQKMFNSGPKILTSTTGNENEPLNGRASWITTSKIYGNAILADINLRAIFDTTFDTYYNVINSSLPSGLWLNECSIDLFSFPTKFIPSMWVKSDNVNDIDGNITKIPTKISVKHPFALLSDVITRRTGGKQIRVEKITVEQAMLEVGNTVLGKIYTTHCENIMKINERRNKFIQNLEEANIPSHPLFIKSNNNNSKSTLSCPQPSSADEVCRIDIYIPNGIFSDNESLFTVHSLLSTTSLSDYNDVKSANIILASNPAEAQQFASYNALHALEQLGRQQLGMNELPRYNNEAKIEYIEFKIITKSNEMSSKDKDNKNLIIEKKVEVENKEPKGWGGWESAGKWGEDLGSWSSNDGWNDNTVIANSIDDVIHSVYTNTGIISNTLEISLLSLTNTNDIIDISIPKTELPYGSKLRRKEDTTEENLYISLSIQRLNDKNEQLNNIESNILSKANISIFNPPLSDQRRRAIAAFLRGINAISWLDLGCGDFSLSDGCITSDSVLFVPSLKVLGGLDPNSNRLMKAGNLLLDKLGKTTNTNDEINHKKLKKENGKVSNTNIDLDYIGLYAGSMLKSLKNLSLGYDRNLNKKYWDVITCIEVIEHLPSKDDADVAISNVLNNLKPKYAIFSTPNHETNLFITALKEELITGKISKVGLGIKNAPFREEDHKFEFTRLEFEEYVNKALEASGNIYTAEYFEIGDCNMLPISNSRRPHNCGGATQMVVFTKKDNIFNDTNINLIDSISDNSDDDIDILDDVNTDSEIAINCWNWSNYSIEDF